MEISSRYVGARIGPFDAEATGRRAMNYAAAVGDNNPHYFDDERPDGIVAPPMLSVALTWPIAEKLWDHANVGDFPSEVMTRQVHYTEALTWHRPMRPGDKLRIGGEVAALLPHQAGTYLVVRFLAADTDGKPVFTEHTGALLRGVRCADGGAQSGEVPEPSRSVSAHAPIWVQNISVDPLAGHVYDGCADIAFPIHTSARFARSVGLPRIILHGTATLSLALRELVNREAGGDPRGVKSLACRFTGMVFPGSTITVQLLRKETRDSEAVLDFAVLNEEGKKAISGGRLVFACGAPA